MIIRGRSKRAIEDHLDKAFELETILEERGRFDLVQKVYYSVLLRLCNVSVKKIKCWIRND
jgi:UTP--glucose-1-phosphate uridylyltransferase